MKDRASAESSAGDEGATRPRSGPRLAQLLACYRVQDIATIQEKLVEMEEYMRKLAAVQGELKDLLDQEIECASELYSLTLYEASLGDKYVPSVSVLLAECCKTMQDDARQSDLDAMTDSEQSKMSPWDVPRRIRSAQRRRTCRMQPQRGQRPPTQAQAVQVQARPAQASVNVIDLFHEGVID